MDTLMPCNFACIDDYLEALVMTIEIVSDDRLLDIQLFTAPAILDRILEALYKYNDYDSKDLTYCELVALALQTLRFFPAGEVVTAFHPIPLKIFWLKFSLTHVGECSGYRRCDGRGVD